MSCSNKILISNWPRTRKFSQFLQEGKEATFDSLWSLVDHALCPIFMLWLVKILQVSSCEKFAQRLETCLLIAKANRVLCHLVMFLTAAFKIVLLFMAGFLLGYACQSHWKSDFRGIAFTSHLMSKRVEKSQAISALLDGFQELHLEW